MEKSPAMYQIMTRKFEFYIEWYIDDDLIFEFLSDLVKICFLLRDRDR